MVKCFTIRSSELFIECGLSVLQLRKMHRYQPTEDRTKKKKRKKKDGLLLLLFFFWPRRGEGSHMHPQWKVCKKSSTLCKVMLGIASPCILFLDISKNFNGTKKNPVQEKAHVGACGSRRASESLTESRLKSEKR